MPILDKAARKAILEKIFQEGVESVDKKTLKSLFKSGGEKLYRHDFDPERLLKVGFKPGTTHYTSEGEKNFFTSRKSGIYYTKSPNVIPEVVDIPEVTSKIKTNVVGIKNPNARTTKYNSEQSYWLSDKPIPEDTDFLDQVVDTEGLYSNAREVIQAKPNQVLAKIKIGNKNHYRILGVAGALGAGAALSESDANAGVKSKVLTNVAKEVIKGVESSASKALKGTVYKDTVIQKIIKGKGDWRYLILENGNTELVDKQVVNSLARSSGTAKQVAKFEMGSEDSKLAQAYKSLQMHIDKAQVDKKLIEDFHGNYINQLKAAGSSIPDMSLVKANNKHLSLPTHYAKLLEKEGAVKIIKKLGN